MALVSRIPLLARSMPLALLLLPAPATGGTVHTLQARTLQDLPVPKAELLVLPNQGQLGPITGSGNTWSIAGAPTFIVDSQETRTPSGSTFGRNDLQVLAQGSGQAVARERIEVLQSNMSAEYGGGGGGGLNVVPRRGDAGKSPVVGIADASGRFPFDIRTSWNGDFVAAATRPGSCQTGRSDVPGTGPPRTIVIQEPSPRCDSWCLLYEHPVEDDEDQCIYWQHPADPGQVAQAPGSASPGGAQEAVDPVMAGQWAFKRLGLPLALPWERLAPVTVAVIDTGLDFRHPALRPGQIWVNPEPGADPRFPDDIIGWNFVANHNNVMDDAGHGTFVAGLILAVNPRARIMPLRVLDVFGQGWNSAVARAIVYAVERGARVINLSVGREKLWKIHQRVIDWARSRGVVVVVAAGNEGVSVDDYTPGGVKGALTVAALEPNDAHAGFGNFGKNVALAAPGVDIVSLRASWTDFTLVATRGKDYTAGAHIVGGDRRYYRASGTSFAAPLVAGAASLLFSLYPNLTGGQVERMLVESADDVGTPGWDRLTGAGRLNIARAMFTDPNDYLAVRVSRVAAGRDGAGRPAVQVEGTVDGNAVESYGVELGQGETPATWKTVATETGKTVDNGILAAFPLREITARGKWAVRVVAKDKAGRAREARGSLDVR